MFQALKQLQEIYDTSCKTKTDKITIERTTFENIATTFKQAYEKIKTTKVATHAHFRKHEYPRHWSANSSEYRQPIVVAMIMA
jgi:hypothetical protein